MIALLPLGLLQYAHASFHSQPAKRAVLLSRLYKGRMAVVVSFVPVACLVESAGRPPGRKEGGEEGGKSCFPPLDAARPMTDAARLLSAAVEFHRRGNSEEQEAADRRPLPDAYASAEEALLAMRDALWYEASVSMRRPCADPPEDALLHAVDLGTESAGIVRRSKPALAVLLARNGGDGERPPSYPLFQPVVPDAEEGGPTREVPVRRALADGRAQGRRRLAAMQRRADKEERKEAARREERAAREAETEAEAREREEREGREREAKAEERRARRGQKRDGAGRADKEGSDPPAPRKAARTDVPAPGEAPAEREEQERERACVDGADRVLAGRAAARRGAARRVLFPSPVPCDRHLFALQFADPRDGVAAAVLSGTPSAAVRVVCGPPGTGKTRRLVDLLGEADFGRALVCAPTNVAAAGAYRRLLDAGWGDVAALRLPPSRVPDGTPVASDDPRRRIVCTTVSARAGRALHGQSFDAVFLDEAAQCAEPVAWTLLRADVRLFVMAGDVHQLPARADGVRLRHDRSLMERLIVDLGYPAEELLLQRRMPAAVCSFPNRTWYGGRLVSADEGGSAAAYSCVRVAGGRAEGEEGGSGTSLLNADEAEEVRRQVEALRREEGWTSVAVVVPYRAQARRVLSFGLGVPVHTVDSFQGQEADAIVLSVVRTGGRCGFWEDYRRLNVALTRARRRMVVVGSFDWTAEPLASLLADAEARGLLLGGDAGQI